MLLIGFIKYTKYKIFGVKVYLYFLHLKLKIVQFSSIKKLMILAIFRYKVKF